MASPYFVCSAATGAANGSSWKDAYVSLLALQTGQAIVGGDLIYVHSSHANLSGAGITINFPESGTGITQVLCVDGGDAAFTNSGGGPGGSMGTTVGALATGAVESTNGNFAFIINTVGINGGTYFHGITFKTGAGGNSSTADITVNQGSGILSFSACTFYTHSTNTGALLTFGSTTGPSKTVLNGCTLQFGATGQTIVTVGASLLMIGCKVHATTPPTTLFSPSTRPTDITLNGCDLSASTNVITAAVVLPMKFFASNCVINTPITGTHSGHGGVIFEFHACAAADDLGASTGANILAYFYQDAYGTVQEDTTVYLTTGGALGEQDDGTDTAYSLMMTPSAACGLSMPLYTPWVYALCTTGAKTLTMAIAHTEAAALKDNEVWMEVEYMGEPGATGTTRVVNSPHTQIEVDDDCPTMTSDIARDVLAASGANRTDTSVAWTGVTETETNTLTASVTTDEVGYVRCRIGLGKATTSPVYVDPKIGGAG